jgi:ubiquinone/menaquinone biosynthesis C-methylase UbiE
MDSINFMFTQANKILGNNDVGFMNHGYSPSLSIIDSEDYLFKNQISLYLQMFNNIKTSKKRILEVGCGRGGGASAILKYLKPLSLDACDMNQQNIEYCLKYQPPEINFKQAYAQSLTYTDNFFDIVINVESSHCYNNYPLFFQEVNRVLKKNGTFLYVDCGQVIHNFHNFFHFFKKIIREDITENVKKSCQEDYNKFNSMISDEKIKKLLTDTAIEKANKYSQGNNQYIKYVGYK